MYEPVQPQCGDDRVIAEAETILRRRLLARTREVRPLDASRYFHLKLGRLLHEEFHALWLDVRRRAIGAEMLFRGGLDGAQVVVRTVVQFAVARNAAAVVFAHNHPSGDALPTRQDIALTRRLASALDLFDVQVLDHFVVGEEVISMRKHGCWSPHQLLSHRS